MASTIKVDNVQNQPGTNVVNKCGTTVNIGAASDNIRSAGNNLQASDGGNLISQSGTDITLGASGDTINLASGASQSGFGRTGTVDWQTGDIKTGTFTAADGKGYFINTTAGGVTVNLPAGSAGTIVSFADYARTWDPNAVTVTPDGSEKIGGVNSNASLSTKGQSVTFLYQDSTQGWINVQDSTSAVAGGTFIAATGGCITTSGNYKIHTFNSPGTFAVSCVSACAPNNDVDFLVVAGGASGAHGISSTYTSGAGGAGGARMSAGTATGCYATSPLGSGISAVTVTCSPGSYAVVVGAGGAAVDSGSAPVSAAGNAGNTSSIFCVASAGGGAGSTSANVGSSGGSGGGGSGPGAGGSGNTPPSPCQPQGQNGGPGCSVWSPGRNSGGGGGGAGAGGSGGTEPGGGGAGGAGIANEITGSSVDYAGGGSGSNPGGSPSPPSSPWAPWYPFGGGSGFPGPGCLGGVYPTPQPAAVIITGKDNTGGGGGGGAYAGASPFSGSGAGGSGVVIVRYKYQ